MSVPVRLPESFLVNTPARARLRAVPSPGASPSAKTLLAQARQGLLHAEHEADPAERFVRAHLAALRGAAAVLALRGRPHRSRTRPTSAWVLLAKVAPELAEWATFFQSCASTRHAVESGITRVVSARGADDLVRQTGQFLDLVDRAVHGAGR
jgi:hypothetical protein